MADKNKLLQTMIPIVMDMLDIELDDVIYSDLLTDDQISDVVTAVVVKSQVEKLEETSKIVKQKKSVFLEKGNNTNNQQTQTPIDVNDDDKGILQNAVLLPSSSANCWSVVPSKDFRNIYRMTAPVFQELLHLIVQNSRNMPTVFPCTATTGRTIEMPYEKQLLIALEYLGSSVPISKIAQKYNLDETVTLQAISKITFSIYKLMHIFITWPQEGDSMYPVLYPNNSVALSKCVGVIDVCRINIRRPNQHADYYVDKAGKHSVALQAVCDYKMNFIHCCTGWPGSVSDISILKDSDLFQDVQSNPERFFPEDSYLVGDSAYPLLEWILPPYTSSELYPSQIQFNSNHMQAHNLVNEAFHRLKLRFKRLQFIESPLMEDVVKTILVCCALHNFCQNHGDVITDVSEPFIPHTSIDTYGNDEEYFQFTDAAVLKRDDIADVITSCQTVTIIQ